MELLQRCGKTGATISAAFLGVVMKHSYPRQVCQKCFDTSHLVLYDRGRGRGSHDITPGHCARCGDCSSRQGTVPAVYYIHWKFLWDHICLLLGLYLLYDLFLDKEGQLLYKWTCFQSRSAYTRTCVCDWSLYVEKKNSLSDNGSWYYISVISEVHCLWRQWTLTDSLERRWAPGVGLAARWSTVGRSSIST